MMQVYRVCQSCLRNGVDCLLQLSLLDLLQRAQLPLQFMKTHRRVNSLYLSSNAQNTVEAIILGKSYINAASESGARAQELMVKENHYPGY